MKNRTLRQGLRRLGRHSGGAAAVEFALVAIPFFLLFMGIVEYGLYMMTEVALESAVTQAGRSNAVSFQSGATRVQAVEDLITKKTPGLINASQIFFNENVISTNPATGTVSGGTVAPDVCFPNGINNPPAPAPGPASCDAPSVYIDGNGIPGWQQSTAVTSDGGSGDLVEIRATYPWHVLFPIFNDAFGDKGVVLITSTTVVRNE